MSLVLEQKRALVDKAVKTVMVGIAQRKPRVVSKPYRGSTVDRREIV